VKPVTFGLQVPIDDRRSDRLCADLSNGIVVIQMSTGPASRPRTYIAAVMSWPTGRSSIRLARFMPSAR
jgi:hypothetical protein